jgi:2-isopropylmalate synthase
MASPTDTVRIFDTTLRDGEQSPGIALSAPEKIEIARQLARLGVDVIEAGFAISSPGEREGIRAVSQAVDCVVASLARTNIEDVDAAIESLQGARNPRIHVFIATSDIHMQHKLRMTREQVIEATDAAVRKAKGFCSDVEFSCEDATRTDAEFMAQVVRVAIAAGATTINIPDTVGSASACPRSRAWCCRCTATTISAWPWPTAWPASVPAHARWSAPSTASASGPATPRSRRS